MQPGPSRVAGPAVRVLVLAGDGEEQEGGEERKPQLVRLPLQEPLLPYRDGGPERHERTLVRYEPFDYRSRINPAAAADAEAFQEEAKFFPPDPVAVIAPNRNLTLTARTACGPKRQEEE